ncbi:MAG TPA: hypothetical protein VIT91_05080 [Chthoniobacterales bacterium]
MKNIHTIDPTHSNEPQKAAFMSGASVRPRLQRAPTSTGYLQLRTPLRRTTLASSTDTARFLASQPETSFAEKAVYLSISSTAFVALVYGVLVTLTF